MAQVDDKASWRRSTNGPNSALERVEQMARRDFALPPAMADNVAGVERACARVSVARLVSSRDGSVEKALAELPVTVLQRDVAGRYLSVSEHGKDEPAQISFQRRRPEQVGCGIVSHAEQWRVVALLQ